MGRDLTPRLAPVRALAADYESILAELPRWACRKYHGTAFAKPLSEMQRLYFLGAVELQTDNSWWLTLEPTDVPSVYNHLLRFLLVGRKVGWAN